MSWETLILNDSFDINIIDPNKDIYITNEKINLSFSWTWTLTGSHLEIFKIYDDSLYINYQTFSFLLVISLVWLLLIITLIKVFQSWFNFWFNIFNNKK